ncbi:hypothetical protein [Citricoccus muralis]|uniref:Uncharacterized protein n=1 Tax=Citricoccus muralis TaxID=169134 RepID=A0ABY8H3X5_9MICC|nr:hypothetical protein [Citricoccus muralis]WFP15780.1 hypothetical protein P8192_10270 [Citricoccus muralis]
MDHRIQELEESLASALGALPDVRVPTAMLVLVAVLTWMLLVSRQELQIAPSLRDRVVRRRRQWASRMERRAETRSRPSTSTPGSIRRNTMAPSTPHRSASTEGHAEGPTPRMTVRWGRTAVFLVAVLALGTFLVTGIASAFGAATVTVAGISLLVVVGSLATLRGLALRDQRRRRAQRVEDAFAEAANPSQPVHVRTAPAGTAEKVVTHRDAPVFDHQPETVAPESAERDADTAVAMQAAEATARPVATAETDSEGLLEGTAEDERPAVARVPRPMYLDAAEVTRPEPEPIEPEAEPVVSPNVQLKDGVSAEYQAQLAARAHRRLDLDKVLERRRAI